MHDTAAIGVDVGGTATKAGVISRTGEIFLRAERPTDPQAGTKGIIGVVETLLEQSSAESISIAAIGVGAAGFVDALKGSVTFSPNLVYDDPHIAEALTARTSLPALVDNDANAAAWGEYCFGSAKGAANLAFITLGTGVGSGFVVNGDLLRGAHGAGAELGHMVIDPSGPHCPCGLKGCLEQFASGGAIERWAREAVEKDPSSSILAFAGSASEITGEHVTQAAREYDETARAVLRRAGNALGVGLSNVVNLFEPEAIVLGGSVVRAGEPFLGPARDRLSTMLTAQRRRPARLDVTSLGNDAGVMGAGMLALAMVDKEN
ncbi:MAG TPA: ROK family protein [Actinomycetota bacterium]|nr:ROK family protein [Actinomycetota bacterium]